MLPSFSVKIISVMFSFLKHGFSSFGPQALEHMDSVADSGVLVPPRIKLRPPALGAQSLIHLATREVPEKF